MSLKKHAFNFKVELQCREIETLKEKLTSKNKHMARRKNRSTDEKAMYIESLAL